MAKKTSLIRRPHKGVAGARMIPGSGKKSRTADILFGEISDYAYTPDTKLTKPGSLDDKMLFDRGI